MRKLYLIIALMVTSATAFATQMGGGKNSLTLSSTTDDQESSSITSAVPEGGKYYKIRLADSDYYMSKTASGETTANRQISLRELKYCDQWWAIWKLEATETEGQFNIINIQNGKSLGNPQANKGLFTQEYTENFSCPYSFTAFENGYVIQRSNGSNPLAGTYEENNNKIGAADDEESPSVWILEEYTGSLPTKNIDPSKTYTISSPRGTMFGNATNTLVTNKEDALGTFAFISYEDKDVTHQYLYCIEKKAFVIHNSEDYPNNISSTNNFPKLSSTDFSIIADIDISQWNDYSCLLKITSDDYMLNMNSSNGVVINTWTTEDDGNRLAIVESTDFTADQMNEAKQLLNDYFSSVKTTVTYVVSFYGSTFNLVIENVKTGSEVPTPTVPEYVKLEITDTDVPETVTPNLTIHATASLNTGNDKLGISTAIDAQDAIKFAMKNRDNSKWVFTKDNITETVGDAVTIPELATKDNYLWIITGNWVEGYNIYNVGQKKYLTNDGQTQLSDTPGKFLLKKENGGWGFLQTNNSNVLGDHKAQNGTLGTWSGSANTTDPGSLHVIYSENDLNEIVVSAKRTIVEDVLATAGQGYVFTLSEDDANTLQTQYNALIEANNNDCTTWENLANSCLEKLIQPTTGYYRIENSNTSYAGFCIGFTDRLKAINNSNDASTIIKVTQSGNGTFTLSTQGQYIQNTSGVGGGGYQTVLGTEPVEYRIIQQSPGLTVFSTNEESFSYMHCDGSKNIVGWNATAGASQWHMTPVESIDLSLSGKYTTVYLPFTITLPENAQVEAYALTGVNMQGEDTYAQTQKIGLEIPAGTPVLLINEGNLDTVTARIQAEPTQTIPENMLSGQYINNIATVNVAGESVPAASSASQASSGDFALSMSGDEQMFLPLATENSLAANSAFVSAARMNDRSSIILTPAEHWTTTFHKAADDQEIYLATFFTNKNVYLPEGIIARYIPSQTATEVEDGVYALSYKNLNGNVLPANTAVLLVSNTEGEKVLFESRMDATDTVESNVFTGTTQTGQPATGLFALGRPAGATEAGFYPYSGDEMVPYRAYLDFDQVKASISNAAEITGFILVDGPYIPTDINETICDETEDDGIYYDLSGKRVINPTKAGIYIKNHKKVIIK